MRLSINWDSACRNGYGSEFGLLALGTCLLVGLWKCVCGQGLLGGGAMWHICVLTPHVDVGGATHVAPGEHNQVEHVADDAHGADDGQHQAVAVLPQRFGPRILHILQG